VTTFGELINGFPVTKRSITTLANSATPSFTSTTTVDVDVLPDAITPDEFTLSHYGFPEPHFNTASFSTWMKYLLTGLACMAIAYWIKRRRAAAAG